MIRVFARADSNITHKMAYMRVSGVIAGDYYLLFGFCKGFSTRYILANYNTGHIEKDSLGIPKTITLRTSASVELIL